MIIRVYTWDYKLFYSHCEKTGPESDHLIDYLLKLDSRTLLEVTDLF